jgi:hypothetical protein
LHNTRPHLMQGTYKKTPQSVDGSLGLQRP